MQLLKQIETLFRTGTAGGLTDGQLLERFVERRDEIAEAAFAALVDRHGAMVLRVCRQILARDEDAEDAAQATFLVLARRARSISRRESVACWLHGVALRVAAKARTAATRRHAHEVRGGEMRSGVQVVDAELAAIDDHDDWAKLHDELRTLPESFREPLILCYLEGLTQDQAAAHLHCPIGTIQSRLARGRAKLKARLEKRGLSLSPAFAGDSQLAIQHCPAPAAWAEATVKLAMQFTQSNGAAIAGASAATVALAEDVARAIVMSKLKAAAAMIFFAAVLVTGAAAWAMHDGEAVATVVATNVALPVLKPDDPEKAPEPPERVVRTIRGIVRDEQGQPVSKAWVGREVTNPNGGMEIIEPLDRIRESKEPFRDEQGRVVPAGALGKYFELRDQDSKWQPVHPRDISRVKLPAGYRDPTGPFETGLSKDVKIALGEGKDVFQIRAKGQWEMSALEYLSHPANRTDSLGNFFLEFTMSPEYGAKIVHFASPDFSREAIFAVKYDDPDEELSITLKPVRVVRARVLETPTDHPEESLKWHVFTIDPKVGNLDETPAIRGKGALWLTDFSDGRDWMKPPYDERRFEARLPAGRYKIRFESDTVSRLTEIVVPAGDGPLELPDIQLETLAWVQMLGKPAAEIDAVDLSDKVVKLTDFQGKVVVLSFWSSKQEKEAAFPELPRLAEIRERFKGQPLAILVMHDSSLPSVASLNKAVAPFLGQFKGESPVQFLLDRKRAELAAGAYAPGLGELESGRTSGAYELAGSGATLVIDKSGTLAAAHLGTRFSIGKDGQLVRDSREKPSDDYDYEFDLEFGFALLDRSLEDQFGLPRSPLPKSKQRSLPGQLKGKLVDLDGKPIAGANITTDSDATGKNPIKTGPTGEFIFSVKDPSELVNLNVEASGFVTRRFMLWVQDEDRTEDVRGDENSVSVDPSGVARQPLKMSPGVAVTGRVLQNGKPVARALIGLKRIAPHSYDEPKPLETTTDAQGLFRFPNNLPESEFWAYAKLGTLPDGGAVIPQRIQTAEEGSTTVLGEFHVEKGLTLAGRVICSDGKAVPSGTTIYAKCPNTEGDLSLKLGATGRFEFKGLTVGPVSLSLHPTGYFVSAKNACHDPSGLGGLSGQLYGDVADLTILLEPGEEPHNSRPDPALVADFKDAESGPITGVPPRP